MVALVSYVPDAYFTELTKDSRAPMQLEYLRECLLEERTLLGALADTVWASVASVCGWSSQQLRGRVLRAGHVAIAFITARTLWEAEKMPWSIATGDVGRNLDHLEASTRPTEPTAAKVWDLVHMGYNRVQLKQALALVLDCPWGTASAEQQHASATVVRKYHPEAGQETLLVRSLMHTMRHVLPGHTQMRNDCMPSKSGWSGCSDATQSTLLAATCT